MNPTRPAPSVPNGRAKNEPREQSADGCRHNEPSLRRREHTEPSALGSTIYKERVARGWTMERLAEEASAHARAEHMNVRMTKATVSAIESGRQRGAQPDTLRSLALALGLNPAYLALQARQLETPRQSERGIILSPTAHLAHSDDHVAVASRHFASVPCEPDLSSLRRFAIFALGTLFQKRVDERDIAKQAVAAYIAKRFCVDGSAMFVSDGSSTFYVCIAIAEKAKALENRVRLLTNNIAFAAELAARHDDHHKLSHDYPRNPDQGYDYPRNLDIEYLGGDFIFALQATFRSRIDVRAFIDGIPLVITSARYLTVADGPVGPEDRSRGLKHAVLDGSADVVFAVDWEKLCPKSEEYHHRVYTDTEQWFELLRKRRVWIVCDKPDGAPTDTFARGQELAQHFVQQPTSSLPISKIDRYCLEAYRFATFSGGQVKFVEVAGIATHSKSSEDADLFEDADPGEHKSL